MSQSGRKGVGSVEGAPRQARLHNGVTYGSTHSFCH
jgi:hypothetical protein